MHLSFSFQSRVNVQSFPSPSKCSSSSTTALNGGSCSSLDEAGCASSDESLEGIWG